MAEELKSIEQIRPVLEQRPLAVLTDMDGTLAPIVDRPADAYVPLKTKQAVSELLRSGARVAVITGRALDVARQIVDVDGIDFAGSHGVDVWLDGERRRPLEIERWAQLARLAIAELKSVEGAGVWIEDKGFGLAVHYRQSEAPEDAREIIVKAIAASAVAREFEVQEGRKIVELRPQLQINKGTAALEMIERYGAAGVVCMGDDVTDIDMFLAVRKVSGDRPASAIIGVWTEEASAEVLANADWWVDGVEGVEWLLSETARILR